MVVGNIMMAQTSWFGHANRSTSLLTGSFYHVNNKAYKHYTQQHKFD